MAENRQRKSASFVSAEKRKPRRLARRAESKKKSINPYPKDNNLSKANRRFLREFAKGKTKEEISAALGLTEGSYRVRLHLACKELNNTIRYRKNESKLRRVTEFLKTNKGRKLLKADSRQYGKAKK